MRGIRRIRGARETPDTPGPTGNAQGAGRRHPQSSQRAGLKPRPKRNDRRPVSLSFFPFALVVLLPFRLDRFPPLPLFLPLPYSALSFSALAFSLPSPSTIGLCDARLGRSGALGRANRAQDDSKTDKNAPTSPVGRERKPSQGAAPGFGFQGTAKEGTQRLFRLGSVLPAAGSPLRLNEGWSREKRRAGAKGARRCGARRCGARRCGDPTMQGGGESARRGMEEEERKRETRGANQAPALSAPNCF